MGNPLDMNAVRLLAVAQRAVREATPIVQDIIGRSTTESTWAQATDEAVSKTHKCSGIGCTAVSIDKDMYFVTIPHRLPEKPREVFRFHDFRCMRTWAAAVEAD